MKLLITIAIVMFLIFNNLGNFGMLKEGYRADMILLNSNLITDIKNISDISTIWKEGKVVANNE
ncbi:MAG: hypothetical protein CMC13_06340 [Flavobacteriaceae bacterium]|nr:hypothetical protein [Flavobacteriaceae bacterium]|tara:strand:- start:496 stop:687 length:192 start_codon:yes stop_codon:yes gene_type:complete